jgi:ribonuclease-3
MDDKNIKLSPWNLNNKLLTLDDIYNIYEKAGFTNALNIIKINDINLYQTAFIHTSYTKNNCENDFKNKPRNVIDLFDEDYENMEFLGDRCLDLSIAFYLHRMYPTMDQGFKTKMKTKLVKKDTLAKFARFLGFSDLIIISKHIEEKTNEGRNNSRILEDVFEAFLCAIFLDQNKNIEYQSPAMKNLGKYRLFGPGWQIVNAFVENLLEFCIDFEELVLTHENHKETLLQYYQKEFKITPKYLELSIEGPPHNRIFTMGVLDKNGDIISRGVAKSKKEAEQQASLNALKYFGENTNILYDSDN